MDTLTRHQKCRLFANNIIQNTIAHSAIYEPCTPTAQFNSLEPPWMPVLPRTFLQKIRTPLAVPLKDCLAHDTKDDNARCIQALALDP